MDYNLSEKVNDNTDAKPNVIVAIKDTKLDVAVITLSAKDNQKLSILSKAIERSVYWNEYETKCENKNTTIERIYSFKSLKVQTDFFDLFKGRW